MTAFRVLTFNNISSRGLDRLPADRYDVRSDVTDPDAIMLRSADLHAVTTLDGSFDGQPLGALAAVNPPCRFGFSSTPARPSVTSVVTTVVTDPAAPGIQRGARPNRAT